MYYNDEHLGYFGACYMDTIPGGQFMLFVGKHEANGEGHTNLIYMDENAQRTLLAELQENLKVHHGG
jgi:hypothetical protein